MKGETMNRCGRMAIAGRRAALAIFVLSLVAAGAICVMGCTQEEEDEEVSVAEYIAEQAEEDAQQASQLPSDELEGVLAQVDKKVIAHDGAESLGRSQEYALLSYYFPQEVDEAQTLVVKDFEELGWQVVNEGEDGYWVFEGGDEQFNRVLVNFYESDAGSTMMAEFINWQSL